MVEWTRHFDRHDEIAVHHELKSRSETSVELGRILVQRRTSLCSKPERRDDGPAVEEWIRGDVERLVPGNEAEQFDRKR